MDGYHHTKDRLMHLRLQKYSIKVKVDLANYLKIDEQWPFVFHFQHKFGIDLPTMLSNKPDDPI